MKSVSKSWIGDMTSGPIIRKVVLFSLPLMIGNLFQMLYNTVDSIVVGRFVSTQALAAVGLTAMIVNIMVFFFNGFSVGAGVVISRHFGARDIYRLTWNDLRIDPIVTRQIFAIGMPAGIQSVITSISNVFVQSYVNYFGSACIAGCVHT